VFHTYAATKNYKEKKASGHVANATLKNTKKKQKKQKKTSKLKLNIEHNITFS
jgi:hypothetical protein